MVAEGYRLELRLVKAKDQASPCSGCYFEPLLVKCPKGGRNDYLCMDKNAPHTFHFQAVLVRSEGNDK